MRVAAAGVNVSLQEKTKSSTNPHFEGSGPPQPSTGYIFVRSRSGSDIWYNVICCQRTVSVICWPLSMEKSWGKKKMKHSSWSGNICSLKDLILEKCMSVFMCVGVFQWSNLISVKSWVCMRTFSHSIRNWHSTCWDTLSFVHKILKRKRKKRHFWIFFLCAH